MVLHYPPSTYDLTPNLSTHTPTQALSPLGGPREAKGGEIVTCMRPKNVLGFALATRMRYLCPVSPREWPQRLPG